jgi:hypothetical protein
LCKVISFTYVYLSELCNDALINILFLETLFIAKIICHITI